MLERSLGAFEFDILAVLMRHPDNSYGSTIRQRLTDQTKREPSLGALYTTLDRLETKGFVKSSWGVPTAVRGGRRKRFYAITDLGLDAVQHTVDHRRIWQEV